MYNKFQCSDGYVAHCSPHQICNATTPFTKGDWTAGCRDFQAGEALLWCPPNVLHNWALCERYARGSRSKRECDADFEVCRKARNACLESMGSWEKCIGVPGVGCKHVCEYMVR